MRSPIIDAPAHPERQCWWRTSENDPETQVCILTNCTRVRRKPTTISERGLCGHPSPGPGEQRYCRNRIGHDKIQFGGELFDHGGQGALWNERRIDEGTSEDTHPHSGQEFTSQQWLPSSSVSARQLRTFMTDIPAHALVTIEREGSNTYLRAKWSK